MNERLYNSIDPETVILVTAGASGIGRTIAETFLSHTSRVHVCDIDPSAIDDFLSANSTASAFVADVSSVEMVDALFNDLEARYGRLDVLVNNAGVAGPTAPAEDIEPADWNHTVAVNLNGHFYCARRAIPLLKKSACGSIIEISSSTGLHGCPNRAPYASSKWALIGLAKTLAMELGEFGIRVNAICPGSVEGERIEQVIECEAREQGRTPGEIRNAYLRQTSMRRFINPQEVANMALFLASDQAGGISGQAMGVDGHTESLSNVLV
jgi:NAD(P)-dependent dehydrogenase (short-subunit alcohol dehydrogenase family)